MTHRLMQNVLLLILGGATAASVGRRRDTAAPGSLGGLLGHPDPQVASAAATALGQIGTPADATNLQEALPEVSEAVVPAVCQGLLHAAQRLLEDGHRDRAISIYELLTSEGRDPLV